MSVYLDASVLVAFFLDDPRGDRVAAFLRGAGSVVIVSDFAAAEFSSAVARLVRMGELTPEQARVLFESLDIWTGRAAERAESGTADIAAATGYLRRLDLNLRTPDAINLAIAARLGATLYTFDDGMAACARTLGIPLTPP